MAQITKEIKIISFLGQLGEEAIHWIAHFVSRSNTTVVVLRDEARQEKLEIMSNAQFAEEQGATIDDANG